MTHLLAMSSIVLYIVVTVVYLLQLWRPRRRGRSTRISRAAFLVAFVLHSATIAAIANEPRLRVLDNGADYFLWVSWAIALVFLVFRKRLAYPIVGAFVVPAVVACMASSSYLLHKDSQSLLDAAPGARIAQGVWLSVLHGVPALVSVVSLILALIVSVVFLIVERAIKQRPAMLLETSGPSLQFLDRLNTQLLQVGFVAISFVIVSGGLWAVSEQKPVFSFDTSVLSGIIIWVLLACVLHARLVLQWSPKRMSRLTVFVTASFVISVFLVFALAGRLTHASLWS